MGGATLRRFAVNPAAPSRQHQQAILMLLLANLYWGLSFPIVKTLLPLQAQLVPEAGTWFAAVYSVAPRFLLATIILLVWQGRQLLTITRGELMQGLGIGGFASMGMLLQNDGLHFTSASTSAFLTQFYAILIPIYVALRARRNPGGRVWVSVALVLAGVAILGRFDWQELRFGRGEWETLLASVFFMGQILWLERREYAGNRPMQVTLVMFVTLGAVFWVLAGVTAPSAAALVVPWTSPVWLGLVALLTVFCTVGAFTIMNKWQPKITATEAGLIYCVEPIFGSLMALFLPAIFSVWASVNYPNETATWTLLVGGGLITVANILIQLRPQRIEQVEAKAGL